MTRFQDHGYLTGRQYSGAQNLAARIRLHERFTVNNIGLYQWLFDLLLAAAGSNARVLEVGAGRGDLWLNNRARIPDGWRVTLTDLSGGMLADNRAHLGGLAARFTYQQADAAQLPFDDGAFDVIVANYMLYHVPDLPAVVRELRRVLAPGGVLMAATNGHDHMTEINQVVEQAGLMDGAVQLGIMNVRLAFALQDGATALGAAFGDVLRLDFPTELRVTDAQAVIDYVASMLDDGEADALEPLRSVVDGYIARDGAFRITKETGVFLAR